jgi:molybdopterin/thiamine biosynthesis adenylyltransferase
MKYTLSFLKEDFDSLKEHLLTNDKEEGAFVFCRISRTKREVRFLVKEIKIIPSKELIEQTKENIKISSNTFVPALKKAVNEQECFFLAHSHPIGDSKFSFMDNHEEKKLMDVTYTRIPDKIHGSLVFNKDDISARVWLYGNNHLVNKSIEIIRVLGSKYDFIIPNNNLSSKLPSNFFDRQIRAFGKELQQLLCNLHIGVVGCGGTGSAVVEQLSRLGVGELTLVDGDSIEGTNITRIHGSYIEDIKKKRKKVDVMANMVKKIGLGTRITAIPNKVTNKLVAEELKNCDILFGCTDDHAGRAVLNQLSLRYYIPFIDMGVLIDSHEGIIKNIIGRISIIRPKESCLLCRNRINSDMVNAEMMSKEVYEEQLKEGYVPELEQADPSVITFTTGIASQAVTEMINMLTGFMGAFHSEMFYHFDSNQIRFHEKPKVETCLCKNKEIVGSGDIDNFLGIMWPIDKKEGLM